MPYCSAVISLIVPRLVLSSFKWNDCFNIIELSAFIGVSYPPDITLWLVPTNWGTRAGYPMKFPVWRWWVFNCVLLRIRLRYFLLNPNTFDTYIYHFLGVIWFIITFVESSLYQTWSILQIWRVSIITCIITQINWDLSIWRSFFNG